MISGWLFDAYSSEDKMVFWIKQQNGNTIRLEDNGWSHSIYVASDDKSDLKSIVNEAQHDDNDDNDDDNDEYIIIAAEDSTYGIKVTNRGLGEWIRNGMYCS